MYKSMLADIICGLDIGSSSIRAIVTQVFPSERTNVKGARRGELYSKEKILGVSQAPTKGFSKGIVSNLNLLSDAIEEAIGDVESKANCRVRKVFTNIAGVHIRTFKSRGSVHISDRPREITDRDLARCIESAKLIAMSLDREPIHLIPERFFIDDKMEIDEPVGLFGSKLDVDLNIITCLVGILQNLTKAINLAGYEVEEIITSGTASAFSIFDEKELEEDGLLIDIGKDLTEVSLFSAGKMRDCFYFPFGGDDLTQVLQDKLCIMFEEAEELRVRYGIVTKDSSKIYDKGQILIPSVRNIAGSGEDIAQFDKKITGESWVNPDTQETRARIDIKRESRKLISRLELSNILLPKVEELVGELYKRTELFLKRRKGLPNIYVIGGVSKMDGFIETIEEIFSAPVNMGRIRYAKDLNDIAFSCALGLSRYGASKKSQKKLKDFSAPDNLIGRLVSKIRYIITEYF